MLETDEDMPLPTMDMPLPGPPMVDRLLPTMDMPLPGSPLLICFPQPWIRSYQNLPRWIQAF